MVRTVPATERNNIYLELTKLGFTSQESGSKTGPIRQRKARLHQDSGALLSHTLGWAEGETFYG